MSKKETSIEDLAKAAVAKGMAHVPMGAPYDVRNAVNLAVVAAVDWLVKEMKPQAIKVNVKKGAKASATVEK